MHESVLVAIVSGLLGPVLLYALKVWADSRKDRRTVNIQEKAYSLDERGRSVEEFRAIVDGLKETLVQVERENDALRNRVTQVEADNVRLKAHIDLMETRQLSVLATNFDLMQHNKVLEQQVQALLRRRSTEVEGNT